MNSVDFPRWATDRRLRTPGGEVNIRSEWNMKNSAAMGGDTYAEGPENSIFALDPITMPPSMAKGNSFKTVFWKGVINLYFLLKWGVPIAREF
ncbi:hypothetical protein [Pararhizobium sp.]|uniref:hypothetical protein n=1 Tax=Pararhizobium sp. TaxID=1977563 RepID=UPI003BACD11F